MKKILMLFVILGCTVQYGNLFGNDIWKDLQNMDQLHGTWEGFLIIDIPQNKEQYLPESSLELALSLEYSRGSQNINLNMRINLGKLLFDWANIPEVQMLGFSADMLWDIIVMGFEAIDGFTVSGKYYVDFSMSEDVSAFNTADSVNQIQINEQGNRIKFIFDDAVSFDLGDIGFNEIILQKK